MHELDKIIIQYFVCKEGSEKTDVRERHMRHQIRREKLIKWRGECRKRGWRVVGNPMMTRPFRKHGWEIKEENKKYQNILKRVTKIDRREVF